ncbi:MAG: ferritin-like domain-containing protein [Hyphomicrobium sp.]|jgi:ferritin-like metal-binding protein YciE
MSVKTMDDLFVETLKDTYYAEKQILKALPAMSKKASHSELKHAFDNHLKETEKQVQRLEEVFNSLDVAVRGKKCEAMEGILAEAKHHLDDIEDKKILDAGIISSAQSVEHYEICRYGTLVEWAKNLGHADAARLLEETLQEEKKADEMLTAIARSVVNKDAEQAA